jgi:hypothetical protein
LIRGILPGIKNFSGQKIRWYLASELRDRIRHSTYHKAAGELWRSRFDAERNLVVISSSSDCWNSPCTPKRTCTDSTGHA